MNALKREPMPRPTCHGEETPAALAGARWNDLDLVECYSCGTITAPLRIESESPVTRSRDLICEECFVPRAAILDGPGWDDLPNPTQSDLLRQAIASGQVSAAQVVAHEQAGEYRPEHGDVK